LIFKPGPFFIDFARNVAFLLSPRRRPAIIAVID